MLIQKRGLRGTRGLSFALTLLLLVGLVLAGCAPAAAPETAPPAAAEVPAESMEPRSGGTLTIAIGGEIGTMDVQGGIGIISYPLFAVYNTLVTLTRDMEITPSLAESWEVVDETTYRFHLREGVTFHSGTPFNAEAVKGSVERFLEPGVPGRAYPLLAMVESVDAEDESTVVFHLNSAFPSFPLHIAHVISMIVDAEQATALGAEAFSENPSGTGPFMLEEWTKNDTMTLVRNPDYWEQGRPYLDRLIFKVIPDEATRIVALEAGEVDIVIGVPPADVARLQEDPNLVIDEQTSARSVYLGFAFDEEPFTDIQVRQALAHAVNAQAIVDFVQEGTVQKSSTFYPTFIFGSAEGEIETQSAHDPEQASTLLEAAGWVDGDGDGVREKDGERLSLTLTFPNSVLPAMRQTAEVIQQNFSEVGIELNLDEREWASFVGDWIEKNVQMYIMGVSANTGAPDYVFPNQWTTDGAWNASRYSNPEVDELFAQASTTLDDEQRRTMYQELQQILARDVAAVPLFHMKSYIAMNRRVHGFENHPMEHFWITDTWIERIEE